MDSSRLGLRAPIAALACWFFFVTQTTQAGPLSDFAHYAVCKLSLDSALGHRYDREEGIAREYLQSLAGQNQILATQILEKIKNSKREGRPALAESLYAEYGLSNQGDFKNCPQGYQTSDGLLKPTCVPLVRPQVTPNVELLPTTSPFIESLVLGSSSENKAQNGSIKICSTGSWLIYSYGTKTEKVCTVVSWSTDIKGDLERVGLEAEALPIEDRSTYLSRNTAVCDQLLAEKNVEKPATVVRASKPLQEPSPKIAPLQGQGKVTSRSE